MLGQSADANPEPTPEGVVVGGSTTLPLTGASVAHTARDRGSSRSKGRQR